MESIESKVKHTPGPWKAETVHGHEGNLVYCRITSPNFDHPGGFAYTSIPLKGKTKKQKELAGLYASQGQELAQWNAKLIAAAPELLEALQELYLAVYGGNSVSLKDCMNRSVKADVFEQKIVAVIKKATE